MTNKVYRFQLYKAFDYNKHNLVAEDVEAQDCPELFKLLVKKLTFLTFKIKTSRKYQKFSVHEYLIVLRHKIFLVYLCVSVRFKPKFIYC